MLVLIFTSSQTKPDEIPRSDEDRRDHDDSANAYWLCAALGDLFVGSVVGGLAIGEFFDDRLGTAPVFTRLGIAVGSAAGI